MTLSFLSNEQMFYTTTEIILKNFLWINILILVAIKTIAGRRKGRVDDNI